MRRRNNDERRTALSRVHCMAKTRCLEDTCRHSCKLSQARLEVSDQTATLQSTKTSPNQTVKSNRLAHDEPGLCQFSESARRQGDQATASKTSKTSRKRQATKYDTRNIKEGVKQNKQSTASIPCMIKFRDQHILAQGFWTTEADSPSCCAENDR